ncbi:unnamed protein product [Closterium sp. NIES-65]|nr:unnamed protein product [Closterium sp. NIES-65]
MAEGRRQVVREAMGSIEECVLAWEEGWKEGWGGGFDVGAVEVEQKEGWEGGFDVVKEMAEGRRQVVRKTMGSIEECVLAWEEVRMGGGEGGRSSTPSPSPGMRYHPEQCACELLASLPHCIPAPPFLSLPSLSVPRPHHLLGCAITPSSVRASPHGTQRMGGGRAAGRREICHVSLPALCIKVGTSCCSKSLLLCLQAQQFCG